MTTRSRRTIAAAGAAFVLAAGAGAAFAGGGQGPGNGPGQGPGMGQGPGHRGGAQVAGGEVATYLGLTRAELVTQLRAGKSLAQIATAQGKSVSGLKDVIYAAAKTRLDKAVANGRLTAAQEQTLLTMLKAHLDDIVNHTGPPAGKHGGHGGKPMIGAAVATYLGLSQAELRTQLHSGKSLAQIAVAQGKTVAGLKAAILAEAKTRLDKAVADGKLTAAQAKAALDRLSSHLDDLVNRTGPKRP